MFAGKITGPDEDSTLSKLNCGTPLIVDIYYSVGECGMLNYNIELNQIRSGSDIRVSDDDIEDLEQYIESKLDGESINDFDNNELVINFEGTIENLI